MFKTRSCIATIASLFITTCLILLFSCSMSRNVLNIQTDYTTKSYDYKPTPSVANAYNSTVSVFYKTLAGDLFIKGSGVIIRNQKNLPIIVITANHVIKAINEERLDPRGYIPVLVGSVRKREFTSVQLFAVDKDADLALLIGIHLNSKDGPSAKIATDLPEIGAKVWSIGSPRGKERNTTFCCLSHVFDINSIQYYRTCSPIYFGDSGGGMFNERQELIGIIHAVYQYPGGSGRSYVVPGSGHATGLPHIQQFVKKAMKQD